MFDVQSARHQMIEQQVRAWDVLDLRVLEAHADRCRAKSSCHAALSRHRVRRHERAARPRPVHARAECRGPHPAGACDPAAPTARSKSARAAATSPRASAQLARSVRTIELVPDFVDTATRQPASATARTTSPSRSLDAMTLAEHGAYDVIALTGSLPVYDPRFERALKPGRTPVRRGRHRDRCMDAQRITRTGTARMDRARACSSTGMDPLVHAPAAAPVRRSETCGRPAPRG